MFSIEDAGFVALTVASAALTLGLAYGGALLTRAVVGESSPRRASPRSPATPRSSERRPRRARPTLERFLVEARCVRKRCGHARLFETNVVPCRALFRCPSCGMRTLESRAHLRILWHR